MTPLYQLKDRLWVELGELYEAGCAAQERLEESDIIDPVAASHDPAGRGEADGLSGSKPAGS